MLNNLILCLRHIGECLLRGVMEIVEAPHPRLSRVRILVETLYSLFTVFRTRLLTASTLFCNITTNSTMTVNKYFQV